MEPATDPYENVALAYMALLRQDSTQASAAIGQIHAAFGAQAALRAALVITIFRMEVKQNGWLPDTRVYSYLIRDYPKAVPLLEYAIGCCLQNWGMRQFELADLSLEQPSYPYTEAQPTAPP